MTDVVSRFDAFLSYARDDDGAFRDHLRAGLSRAGLSVWFDREALPNRGTTFDQEIRRAIEASDRLLLVIGQAALVSSYVTQEWGFADDLGLPVVPILRAGSFNDLPAALRSYHSVDARPPRSEDDIVAELVRLLSTRPQVLGTLHFVPFRQPNEWPRGELLDAVSVSLGLDRQRPRDAGRAPRGAALYGMSGSGKSTVAAAFAGATRTRRSFPDGIVWLKCGALFEPLAGARTLLASVAVGAHLPGTVEEVGETLTAGIGAREILVILDDLRDPRAAAPFLSALGAGGRALITTLDQAVASSLGAVEIEVDRVDDASARQILEGWTGAPLPPQADEVLAAVDGLPFALALIGSMVHNRVSWKRIVEALDSRRIDLIASEFTGYPHPNLLRALGASYDALRADDATAARCYLQMAALRPGAALTESVLVRLWSRAGGCDPLEASFALPKLERRLLVRRQDTPDGERLFLHGLHEDFVRLQCENIAALEAALVASYREDRRNLDWSSLDDDGYVYQHLIAHLASSQARADLIAAVNADWVHGQLLRSGDLVRALDDVRIATETAVRPPLDVTEVGSLGLLAGRVMAMLRTAPPTLIATLAALGEHTHALHWASDNPDPSRRFDALCLVAQALIDRGETSLGRAVITAAAETIPRLGGMIETGLFSGLTALNAVHTLVHFPFPDQWEGTTESHVALARIPVDAVLRLAPLAQRVDALAELAQVRHPFWELYAHLIPLVAVEQLATSGQADLAAALLARTADAYEDDSDMSHAGRYRRAVANAAIGQFDEARVAIDALPPSYRAVGFRGLATHLAAAGHADEAIALLEAIDDPVVGQEALSDVIEAAIDLRNPEACNRVGEFAAFKRDWVVAAAWLFAAGGRPEMGLELVERAPRDDLRLGLGNRLGIILLESNRREQSQQLAAQLVPAAERLLGPQWFAPETIDVAPDIAALGRALLNLVARSGAPLPETVIPLALVIETNSQDVSSFKLELIVALVIAHRFADARQLAEVSAAPGGVALGLATALSLADANVVAEERQAAVTGLIAALGNTVTSDLFNRAMGAVMRMLTSNGFDDDAARLAHALLPYPALAWAVGLWTLDRAKRGAGRDVQALVHKLLVDSPLIVASGRARALLLSVIAHRRSGSDKELADAATLLADTAVAAGSLDVVFDVVSLHTERRGFEAAASVARAIAGGRAGDIVEKALAGEAVSWSDATSEQEIAASFCARAVAAAAMAVALARDDAVAAGEWMTRADSLTAVASRFAPWGDISKATAKYLHAARTMTGTDAGLETELRITHAAAWLLWDHGHPDSAARLADAALGSSNAPGDALPQVVTVGEFERRLGIDAAMRAGLESLVAMIDATTGRTDDASASALSATARMDAAGVLWLTPAERAEINATIAIGLMRAGQADLALTQFQWASSDAVMLARRGEVGGFDVMCRALAEVLPADRANAVWATWLSAAGEAGANEALVLLAQYVRWSLEIDLSSVVVDADTGELRHKAT